MLSSKLECNLLLQCRLIFQESGMCFLNIFWKIVEIGKVWTNVDGILRK